MWQQCQAKLTTCDQLQRSRMGSNYRHFVVEVVGAMRSVHFQLWLGSFRMNTFVGLQLQEGMAECSARKHEHWRGCMTILVVNDGIIKSISILTTVMRAMGKYDVDYLQDCFCDEVKWTLAIRSQLLTLAALYLVRVHHLPHHLPLETDIYSLPEWNQWITMLCVGFNTVAITKLCYVVPYWLNKMRLNLIDLRSNLVPVWVCNIQRVLLLQHTSFNNLPCVCLTSYAQNFVLLHSGVPVHFYYLPVWGFS